MSKRKKVLKAGTPHPFSKWFNRKKFKLIRGRDFVCMTHCMAVQLRRYAAKEGYEISIHIMDDILDVKL